MMPVPIDADAGISKPLVATVKRNVVVDLSFIVFDKLLGAQLVLLLHLL